MKYTHKEWFAEAERRFGSKMNDWKFICPVCKHVQSGQDYKDAGAPEGTVAFSCVGRWIDGSRDAFEGEGPGPCTYAGGGLFRLNPVTVTQTDGAEIQAFDFAPVDELLAMGVPSREAKFKDYDSAQSRGTLCLLADDYGSGTHLGQVFEAGGSWTWEAADTDYEDDDDPSRGEEDTRRLAKRALRKFLKETGVLV